jgi:nucleotide-binding universal stress UspA family protein
VYKKILVPMALDHGISADTLNVSRALLAPDGAIVALHVYEAPQGSAAVYLDEELVKSGFEAARTRLQERIEGLDGVTAVILKGHTARTIIDYADQNDVDCIVIGSHKPGLKDFLLGSTAARVVRHSGCSVHVLRTHA